jgi:hypothetical protein
MGSGPSKDEPAGDAGRQKKAKEQPVANVNNDSRNSNGAARKNEDLNTPTKKHTFITQQNEEEATPSRRKEETNAEKQGNGGLKRDVWRMDSNEDDLDYMLQQPVSQNNREKKTNRPPQPSRTEPDEDLPETYAQRKQREQYTLNQQMLIRQKTIYRNPDDWRDEPVRADR